MHPTSNFRSGTGIGFLGVSEFLSFTSEVFSDKNFFLYRYLSQFSGSTTWVLVVVGSLVVLVALLVAWLYENKDSDEVPIVLSGRVVRGENRQALEVPNVDANDSEGSNKSDSTKKSKSLLKVKVSGKVSGQQTNIFTTGEVTHVHLLLFLG
jgi:hypothetical protein